MGSPLAESQSIPYFIEEWISGVNPRPMRSIQHFVFSPGTKGLWHRDETGILYVRDTVPSEPFACRITSDCYYTGSAIAEYGRIFFRTIEALKEHEFLAHDFANLEATTTTDFPPTINPGVFNDSMMPKYLDTSIQDGSIFTDQLEFEGRNIIGRHLTVSPTREYQEPDFRAPSESAMSMSAPMNTNDNSNTWGTLEDWPALTDPDR